MAHALLSASSAERWINCTPSARLTEKLKDAGSVYAAEGTLAHRIGELRLMEYLHPSERFEADWEAIKKHDLFYEGMIDEVSAYTDYAIEQYNEAVAKTGDPLIYLEERLDYSKYVPEGFGTGDCIIIADGTLEIIDLKFGKGVEVSAEDNPQLMLYALGAYEKYSFIYDIKNIKMTIAQVRLGNISSSTMPIKSLLTWADTVVRPAAKLAFAGEGEQVPGSWCKFCGLKAECKARYEKNMAFVKKYWDAVITPELMAAILDQSGEIVSWISDVTETALMKALDGEEIPGYKVVEGRSNRKISDEAALALILEKETEKPEYIWKPKALETITALEKLFGKKRFAELARAYIIKPPGKPTLVPNSDKRPALNSPEDDFEM
jgi:hypothetical protein